MSAQVAKLFEEGSWLSGAKACQEAKGIEQRRNDTKQLPSRVCLLTLLGGKHKVICVCPSQHQALSQWACPCIPQLP